MKQLTPEKRIELVSLGKEFGRLRRMAGYTQSASAMLFGISQSAISQLERGILSVTEKHLAILRRAVRNPRGEMRSQLRPRKNLSPGEQAILAELCAVPKRSGQ